MYRSLIIGVLLTGLIFVHGTMASEVKLESPLAAKNGGLCWLGVYGMIDERTPVQIQAILTKYRCKDATVFLESLGGDLDAAMEAGRIIRRAQGKTFVSHETKKCASACVLVFLGGAVREGFGQIGIHRPFSTAISSSAIESKYTYDKINERVKQYLLEMNIPAQLLDMMNSVPPGKVRWLNMLSDRDKLKEMLIIGTDPAIEDASDSSTANSLGISKEELYRRKHEADTVCGNYDGAARMTREEYDAAMRCRVSIVIDGKPLSRK
jgi:hypothetical protein